MKPAHFFLTILSILFCLSTAAQDRVALVIGINDYPEDSNFHSLKNCINDATLISETLKSVGFEVIIAENPNLSALDEKLSEFEGKIKQGGTALVYFAGHGIEFEKTNYLMASNAKFKARSRLSDEAIRAETFASAMVQAGAKSSFLLLDCCRELPASAEWAGRGQKRYGLADIDIEGDIVISMAASPGKQALEPSEAGGNSPYATALAKWIPSGLKHTELFDQVRRDVFTITEEQQRPWENGSFIDPFYFAVGNAVKKPVNGAATAQLAAMQAKIDELSKALAAKNTDAKEIARMQGELETMKRTALVPSDSGHSASGPTFEGTKAGESRTIGGIEMVWCPPTGEQGFLMGSPLAEAERKDYEKQHRVILTKGFWLAKTECTQGQWQAVMGTTPEQQKAKGDAYGDLTGKGSNHPMGFVNWEDAVAFCEKLDREQSLPAGWKWSLPTEAQWEYACRAGTTTPFHFGASLHGKQANCDGGAPYGTTSKGAYLQKTAEVGSYAPNNWGLLDMHGNLSEWCLDWYDEGYYVEGQHDPTGPVNASYRVFRGGSWNGFARNSRAAQRFRFPPSNRSLSLGFRMAVSSTPSQ